MGEAIERLSFNTAIAGIMECLNALEPVESLANEAERAAMGEAVRLLALVMTPVRSRTSRTRLAQAYGARTCTVTQPWPAYDPALVVDDVIPYAVQVNGKLRAELRVPVGGRRGRGAGRGRGGDARPKAHLQGSALRKVVFVPKRLINFVVG